jgi:hypothetical protein
MFFGDPPKIDLPVNAVENSRRCAVRGVGYRLLVQNTKTRSNMPAFSTLWRNHPNVKGDGPLLDKTVYENQCAINLGAALMRSGVTLKSYSGAWSWNKEGNKYPIRAEELARWLASPAAQLPKPLAIDGKNFPKHLTGKTGIIFFRDYWGTGRQGDHIDLWNGSRLTDLLSYARIYARVGSFGIGSDYRGAKAILFWPVA